MVTKEIRTAELESDFTLFLKWTQQQGFKPQSLDAEHSSAATAPPF